MQAPADRLELYITHHEPFGPEDQTLIPHPEDAARLLYLTEPISSAFRERYNLIYGRKGSGKSAIISGYAGYQQLKNAPGSSRMLQAGEDPIVVPITTFEQFHEMTQNVARTMGLQKPNGAEDDHLQIPVPVEKIESVWKERIWEAIFRQFYLAHRHHIIGRIEIGSVVKFFEAGAALEIGGPANLAVEELFADAKIDVNNYLTRSDKRCFILFDNLEDYPINNPIFAQVMSGFLRAINRFKMECPKAKIVFALPEELLPHFKGYSSNILKDFAHSARLTWKPAQLLRIAAYRYVLFLKMYDRNFLKELGDIDIILSSHAKKVFHRLLPKEVVNELGAREPTAAYIFRHTQLLPRHFIKVLNEIAAFAHDRSGAHKRFEEVDIRRGVKKAEVNIAEEILKPYEFLYEGLKNHLRTDLCHLPPIFRYGELDHYITRMRRRLKMSDHFAVWGLLFNIGIIGKLKNTADGAFVGQKYVPAEFTYTRLEGTAGTFPSDSYYCFHPIFSTFFDADKRRDKDDQRMIYPDGTPEEFE